MSFQQNSGTPNDMEDIESLRNKYGREIPLDS